MLRGPSCRTRFPSHRPNPSASALPFASWQHSEAHGGGKQQFSQCRGSGRSDGVAAVPLRSRIRFCPEAAQRHRDARSGTQPAERAAKGDVHAETRRRDRAATAVSGASMLAALRQIYPPFPIVHTGVVGADVCTTIRDTSPQQQRAKKGERKEEGEEEGEGAHRPIKATAQHCIKWWRFQPTAHTAPASAVESEAASALHGYPDILSRHILLPSPQSPLPAPLRAVVRAITKLPSATAVAAVGGGKAKEAKEERDFDVGHWGGASPSLYDGLVAPLQLPQRLLQSLRELTLVREQQQVPSLVLLEEKPREDGRKTVANRDDRDDNDDDDGEEEEEEGEGAEAKGEYEVLTRPLHLRVLPVSQPGAGWRLLTEDIAVVEAPVVVSTQRIPFLLGVEGEGSARRHEAAALAKALHRSQGECLRRQQQQKSSTKMGEESALLPWVWAGDGWFQEVDPQLARVAHHLANLGEREGAEEGAEGGGDSRRQSSPVVHAWLPPYWHHKAGTGLVLPTAVAAATAASHPTALHPLTILLMKTWTLAGAGALSDLLSKSAVVAAHRTGGSGEAETEDRGDAEDVGGGAAVPALSEDLPRCGLQKAVALFPNYDAHTGVPFHAVTREVADGIRHYEGGASGLRGGPAEEVEGALKDDGEAQCTPAGIRNNADKTQKRVRRRRRRLQQVVGASVLGRALPPTTTTTTTTTAEPLLLAYLAQAVCWLKASAKEFARPSLHTPLTLLPMKRVPLFCDPEASNDEREEEAGCKAPSTTPPVAATATATLHQTAYITGFPFNDMPDWFTSAFPSAAGSVWKDLCELLPPLDAMDLVVHGGGGVGQTAGFVYVLQLVTGPGEARRHPLLSWHRYRTEDTRINSLYTVSDSLGVGGAEEEEGLRHALCKGSGMQLSPSDTMFLDIRAALLLLASLPSSAADDDASQGVNDCASCRPLPRPKHIIAAYESCLAARWGNPSPEASFALSCGAGHFVDVLFMKARRPLRWSFEALGEAIASQLPEEREEEPGGLTPQEQAPEVREGEGAAQSAPEALPVPGQESFLRSLEIRRLGSDNDDNDDGDDKASAGATAATEAPGTWSSASSAFPLAQNLPAVDRRAFTPGSRLCEAFTHPSRVPRLRPADAVTLGKRRVDAILTERSTAQMERSLFSFSTRPRRRVENGGGGDDDDDNDAVCRLDAHVAQEVRPYVGPGAGAAHGVGEGGGNRNVAEECIRAERDRTQRRWSPWMPLIATPLSSFEELSRRRAEGAGDVADPSADAEEESQDILVALQSLITSPLSESSVVEPPHSSRHSPSLPQQERATTPLFYTWDLGIVMLCIRYKEPYINAVNTAFPDDV